MVLPILLMHALPTTAALTFLLFTVQGFSVAVLKPSHERVKWSYSTVFDVTPGDGHISRFSFSFITRGGVQQIPVINVHVLFQFSFIRRWARGGGSCFLCWGNILKESYTRKDSNRRDAYHTNKAHNNRCCCCCCCCCCCVSINILPL